MGRTLIRTGLLVAALIFGSVAVGRLSASVPRDTGPAAPDSERAALLQSSVVPAVLAEPAQPPAAAPQRVAVEVRSGDTLAKLLARAGVEAEESHAAIAALREHYDPRHLRPGQEVGLVLAPSEAGGGLLGLTLAAAVDRDLSVTRDGDGGFDAREVKKKLRRAPVAASGTIEDSLYVAASRAGMPAAILVEMIRAFSYDVDFQRDIQTGDGFETLYETLRYEDGSVATHGQLLYAALTLGGKKIGIYRYEARDGTADFFHENGHSVRKALLRTPVDGAKLTSRFGTRRHPILGYNRMHRGVDFGAARGTPVMAAGDGVVARASWYGGYGKYIQIRHNSTYSTAYAHLDGYAHGIRAGTRIRQGQVIGYVGSTGRSTGPHLHYEVLRGNRQVNPLSVKLPTGEKLKGDELARFRTARADLDRQFADLANRTRLARAD